MVAEALSSYVCRFAAALEAACAPPAGLITALSGGPDSTALALLAEAYAQQKAIPHRCIIVDHGLRSEAGAESKRVVARMMDRGIAAKVVRVETPPPSSGIQEWARSQRYALLGAAARQSGAVLLVGHHANDQAETVFMRLSRGSGLGGLAGMARCRRSDGIEIVRPLLDWMPQDLITLCHHWGCEYEIDPSNYNQRFERVQSRQALSAMANDGPGVMMAGMTAHLNRLAAASGKICQQVDRALSRHLDMPRLHPHGYVQFSSPALDCLPDDLWRRVIGIAVRAVGGPDYLPSHAAFSRLRARLAADQATTLGMCRFVRIKGTGEWRVLRELGRRPLAQPVAAGAGALFAGIWQLSSSQDGIVRWLGDSPCPPEWQDIQHVVRQSLPVIETLDGRLLYPQLKESDKTGGTPCAASARFLALKMADLPVMAC